MRVLTGAVIAGVIGLFAWLWGPQILTGLTMIFVGGAFILIPLVVLCALFIAAFLFEGALRGVFAVLLVGIGVLTVIGWVRYDYDVKAIYAADATEVNQAAPEFSQRAPFDVATASSTRNLGDTTGDAQNVKILADQGDHGVWTALVTRRGWLQGYESLQSIDVPLYGTANASTVTTCDFDNNQAEQRLSGLWPHESLAYLVLGATPANVNYDDGDVYAYCDDDTPMIVVPLKALSGFWTPTWTVFGAAVYDGSTGLLSVLTDTSEVPGPVYPQSLAKTQREALTALGSFEDAFFARSGYEDTHADTDDPNRGNTSEFSLRFDGKNEAAFVTPLTPRGDSTSIIAISVVDASTSKAGTRNPLNIYRYDDGETRAANSSIAQSIKTQYSWMPDWASGLTIFEIVPADNGTWVASIGQSQSVVYRAVIDADGDAVLYGADGEEVTRSSVKPDPGVPTIPVEPGGTGGTDVDLGSMTPEQLRELATSIVDELANRVSR